MTEISSEFSSVMKTLGGRGGWFRGASKLLKTAGNKVRKWGKKIKKWGLKARAMLGNVTTAFDSALTRKADELSKRITNKFFNAFGKGFKRIKKSTFSRHLSTYFTNVVYSVAQDTPKELLWPGESTLGELFPSFFDALLEFDGLKKNAMKAIGKLVVAVLNVSKLNVSTDKLLEMYQPRLFADVVVDIVVDTAYELTVNCSLVGYSVNTYTPLHTTYDRDATFKDLDNIPWCNGGFDDITCYKRLTKREEICPSLFSDGSLSLQNYHSCNLSLESEESELVMNTTNSTETHVSTLYYCEGISTFPNLRQHIEKIKYKPILSSMWSCKLACSGEGYFIRDIPNSNIRSSYFSNYEIYIRTGYAFESFPIESNLQNRTYLLYDCVYDPEAIGDFHSVLNSDQIGATCQNSEDAECCNYNKHVFD